MALVAASASVADLAQACLKKDALRSFNHCDIFKLKELGLDLRVQENDHDFGNIMGARLGRVSLVVTDLEEKPYFDGQEDIVESLKSKSSRCIYWKQKGWLKNTPGGAL